MQKIAHLVSHHNPDYTAIKQEFAKLSSIPQCLLEKGDQDACAMDKNIIIPEILKIAETGAPKLTDKQRKDLQIFFEIKINTYLGWCTVVAGGFGNRQTCNRIRWLLHANFTVDDHVVLPAQAVNFMQQKELLQYFFKYCDTYRYPQETCQEFKHMFNPFIDLAHSYSRQGQQPNDDAFASMYRILDVSFNIFKDFCFFSLKYSVPLPLKISEAQKVHHDLADKYRKNLSTLLSPQPSITYAHLNETYFNLVDAAKTIMINPAKRKVYEEILGYLVDRAKSFKKDYPKFNNTLMIFVQLALLQYDEEFNPKFVPSPRIYRFRKSISTDRCLLALEEIEEYLLFCIEKLRENSWSNLNDGLRLHWYKFNCQLDEGTASIDPICRDAPQTVKQMLLPYMEAWNPARFVRGISSVYEFITLFNRKCKPYLYN
eukprot:TRINITY_DN2692_c0_g1_i2.p1 TRINITY_DN2692_c0_g1~~TRINITY_DN2692_c0_g1_i2.p1  ORF type:complete len:429 (-),score=53.07 TRINITY_DN2692_c0_g1_i2:358-1644(-)